MRPSPPAVALGFPVDRRARARPLPRPATHAHRAPPEGCAQLRRDPPAPCGRRSPNGWSSGRLVPPHARLGGLASRGRQALIPPRHGEPSAGSDLCGPRSRQPCLLPFAAAHVERQSNDELVDTLLHHDTCEPRGVLGRRAATQHRERPGHAQDVIADCEPHASIAYVKAEQPAHEPARFGAATFRETRASRVGIVVT